MRKVDATTGIITTIAGDGINAFAGDGGPASAARFDSPEDIVLDTAGNIYIADADNFRVRKIDASTGVITTIAGAGGGSDDFSGMGGLATAALINRVTCLAFDDTGYLYIGSRTPDTTIGVVSSKILRLNMATGIITQWAGGHMLMNALDYPGDWLDADSAFFAPMGMCFDTGHNLYIADAKCRVRKILAPPHEGGGDTAGGGDTTTVHIGMAGNGLHIYPNPVKNELRVTGLSAPAGYTLYAITGAVVHRGILPAAPGGTIDMQGYPPGVYVLLLQQHGGERVVVRVMRE